MRHSLRLMALALTVASTAFLAPVAHAQDTLAPEGPLFNAGDTNYTYSDKDGKGVLSVSAANGAIGTGLPLITCKLYQNGQTFYGSGISYSGYLIFCMSNYVFQCQAPGKGSYHLAGSPKYQTEFTLSPYSPKM